MRLVTRGDLDGLTCAVLISSCEEIDEIALVHPQLIADRRFDVTRADILANLPWHPECGKWFDNHQLTDERSTPTAGFEGRYGQAPSAAHLVYDHYLPKHPELRRFEELLQETDRLDSANLTVEDIVEPSGYILLGYTLDPRTGLGRFREYFDHLLELLKSEDPRRVFESPRVQERVERIRQQDARFREATLEHSRRDGNVVVTDFRGLDEAPVGNRFLVYTLFPEANVSARIHWGPRRERVAVSVGHSILNRTNRTNVGVLLSLYGGGGHRGAGSCMLAADVADTRIAEIVAALRRIG
jgi:hypothetical protein